MIAAILGLTAAAMPLVWVGPIHTVHKPATASTGFGVPIGLGVVVAALFAPPLAFAFALLLLALRPLETKVAALRRRRSRVAAIPDSLEIIAMAVGAGMSIEEMVGLVARCGPAPIRPLFASAEQSLAVGHRRREVLRQLAAEGGSPLTAVCEVLIAADRDGASVALVLDRLATEAGRARRLAAEERARRAPVLMLAPLTLCSLPAVLIGTVLPFVLLSFGQTSL